MNNIKTFDQLNEEVFGIGRSANPNTKLVDSITEHIFDNKEKISVDGGTITFEMEIPEGHVVISSPMEIIKANDISVKLDGSDVEGLSLSQKNKIQTQLRNYMPTSPVKKDDRVEAFFNSVNVKRFSNFSK